MWTLENRAKYNRDHLRYSSDLTDHEWAYVEPLIPPAKPGGGKRRTHMRAVMDGVMLHRMYYRYHIERRRGRLATTEAISYMLQRELPLGSATEAHS
jgi:hypothetical protein